MRYWFVSLLLFISHGRALAEDSKKPTLLLVPVVAPKPLANDATTLTNLIRVEIGKTSKHRLVSPEELGAIDKELTRQLSGGCDEASCITEVGGALGAQYLVSGSLGKLGKVYVLTLKLVDIEKVTSIGNSSTTAYTLEDFIGKVEEATLDLFAISKSSPTDPEPSPKRLWRKAPSSQVNNTNQSNALLPGPFSDAARRCQDAGGKLYNIGDARWANGPVRRKTTVGPVSYRTGGNIITIMPDGDQFTISAIGMETDFRNKLESENVYWHCSIIPYLHEQNGTVMVP